MSLLPGGSWSREVAAHSSFFPVAAGVTHDSLDMKIEIEIPDKYASKLDEIEEVEPTIHDQIEVEVMPHVLRLINDAHDQLQDHEQGRLVSDRETDTGE